MKNIIELEKGIKQNKELSYLGMEIAQFFFSKSQENLVDPMPWGDDKYASNRRPSKISDMGAGGGILGSGVPPYWENSKTIVFRYDAPYSSYIEWGTPPHPVGAKRLVGWVNRKLTKTNKSGHIVRLTSKEALRAAYAIATKIRKEGMPPHPFIRPAEEQMVRKYKLHQIAFGVRKL